jgi:hypothetical protein
MGGMPRETSTLASFGIRITLSKKAVERKEPKRKCLPRRTVLIGQEFGVAFDSCQQQSRASFFISCDSYAKANENQYHIV